MRDIGAILYTPTHGHPRCHQQRQPGRRPVRRAAATPEAPHTAGAEQHLDPRERAVMLYMSGRRAEALPAFVAAHSASRDPMLLLSIGRVHLELREPQQARAACQAFRQEVSSPPPEVLERLIELELQ